MFERGKKHVLGFVVEGTHSRYCLVFLVCLSVFKVYLKGEVQSLKSHLKVVASTKFEVVCLRQVHEQSLKLMFEGKHINKA
jgi:hypothetical protein